MSDLARVLRTAVPVLTLACAIASPASAAPMELTGALHEHSGYSDGWPGSTPVDYFAGGRQNGLDFLLSGEHSDNADVPSVFSDLCADPAFTPKCPVADDDTPANSFRKWDATWEYAQAATTPTFTAGRGFEWSSDRFGHINVYFSQEDTNAKADGGYATMDGFYGWLSRSPLLAGGGDGLATFNHPGDKDISQSDPGFNWNDFAHDPRVDFQMVGIELFNNGRDYGTPGTHASGPDGWYAHALDKGWHVGAVGAEDLGHDVSDDWGSPTQAKTVVLSNGRSLEAIKTAMAARRFYAVRRTGFGLTYTVDGAGMGSRLGRDPGAALTIAAEATAPAAELADGRSLKLDLISRGGAVLATSAGSTLALERPAAADEPYYFVRVRRVGGGDDEVVAYSSPVWIQRRVPQGGPGTWLGGELHAHACHSHDVYCGPSDEPAAFDPEDPRTLGDLGGQLFSTGYTTAQRFDEAAARGLDFLAITDHNDVRSFNSDPGFGGNDVVGIPGYENSIRGHANMLGAAGETVYENTEDMQEPVRRLRADGGVFQANHPGYTIESPMASCDQPSQRHWKYGYDLRPDTIEVLNPTSAVDAGEAYLECWLQRGERVALTGGGDSHGAALSAAGMGHPTTWVFGQRSKEGVLAALRAGHTSVSSRPATEGGGALVIEADADGDGTYEAMAGDVTRPGAKVRVRSQSASATGFVRIRANGANLALADDGRLAPGGSVTFMAPTQPGWVRAVLLSQEPDAADEMACPGRGENISPCARDKAIVAMTSALYLTEAAPTPEPDPPVPPPAQPPSQPAAPPQEIVGGDTPSRPGTTESTLGATTGRSPGSMLTLRFGPSSVAFAPRQRASTLLRRGGLRLDVRCGSRAGCRLTGDVQLTRKAARRLRVPVRVGARAVSVRAGRRQLLALRLSARTVRRIRRAGGASLTVRLRVQPAGGAVVVRRAVLTIRPA